MRVLIVDDEADMLHLLKQGIGGSEFEVATAANGEEALRILAQGPFDVMLTDLRMPGISGLELTARVVLEHPKTDVIMLTSHPTSDAVFKALKAGVYDYLNKPIELKLVKAALHRCKEKRALAERLTLAEGKFREAASMLDVVSSKIADLDAKVKAVNFGEDHASCRDFALGILMNVQNTLADLKKAVVKPKL